MARVMLRLLALVALCCGSPSAFADPITGIVLFTIGTTAITVGTALFVLSVASSVYGAIQTKKRARAAAQRAAEQEAANLKDRTTTLLVADSPWPVVYGSPAPVGGSIAAVLTSGANDQFKHVVFLLAAHECDAVEAIYIGGDWIGNLDPSGWADGAEFQLETGVPNLMTAPYELLEYVLDTADGPVATGIGFWVFPAGITVFSGVQGVFDEDGADVSATVKKGFPPNVLGGNYLVGPVGATGTVTYWVDGAGAALNVQVHLSPGGVDVADAFLRSARPDLWTVNHKLSGFTYLVATMNLEHDRFQGGVPEITVKLRGKKVLDDRTGLVAYSRNPALCLADFIRSEAGYGASTAQIEIDALVAAANACDVAVYDQAAVDADPATYGGSRARYTCDGMFRSDQDRDTTRQQLEDAMVGFSLESGGVWRIQAGAWSTPVLSLTDDDMVMPIAIVQTCNVGTARYNGAKGTYANAVRNGVTEDFAPYINPVFRAQDVKDKFHDITLSFTGNHVRTQQISRVLVEQSRGGFVVQIFPKMSAWNLQPGDRVVLSSVLFAFTNKPFRVQDWTYQAGTPVALQCVEDEEAFYDQADETRADAAPNTSLPSPMLKPAAPLDLIALSGEDRMAQQDGVMVVRLLVQWARSLDRYVLQSGVARLQWRLASDGLVWQTIDLPGDATEQYLLGLAVNNVYVVRVQFLTAYASSNWSYVQHELHGLEGPPDSVLGLDVRAELTGIFAYWSEPAGIDLLGWNATQIRRGPSWELAESAILFDGRATSANLGWFPAGSQAVWAAHHNTIGDWSEPVFDVIEILSPGQPLPAATVNNRNQVRVFWEDCATTQPIDFYEIRLGDTWEETVLVGLAKTTEYSTVQPNFGAHRYWVVAIDVAGNRGAPGYATALTLQSFDSVIGNLRSKVDLARDEIAAMELAGNIIAFEQLGKAKAGIYEKIEVVVTDTTALASKYTALSATVDENQALIVSELTTLATEQSALATQVNLVAAITGDNTAAILEETEARTTAVSALASQVTTIQSSVGGLSATVDLQANTLATLDGNVAAQYMMRTEVIGSTGKRALAGISIGVSSTSGGTTLQSEVAVFADRFLVAADASATVADAPFRIEGGVVFMNMAKIKDADIGTLKVGGDALGTGMGATGTGTAAVAFTVPAGQVWRAIALGFSGYAPNSGSNYSETLALSGATSIVLPSVVVGIEDTEGGSVPTFSASPASMAGISEYGAGSHTLLFTAKDAGTSLTLATPLTIVVILQKRGA